MSITTESSADPLPPQRPLERFAQMETDVFCEGCGYNLHGQPVGRDERLGLMVCRCPECGRFHPAGHRTTAISLWMSRWAALGLFFWVLLVLTTIFFGLLGFGGVQMLFVDAMTFNKLVTADGREVDYVQLGGTGGYTQVYAGTTQPVVNANLHYIKTFTPPVGVAVNQLKIQRPWWVPLLILSFAAGVGLPLGMLLVVFLWHWKRRNYLWTLLLPLLTAAFLAVTIRYDDAYDSLRNWAIQRIFFIGSVEMIFMLIGIQTGRPTARLLLRMFVPPKPRHHLAFLWLVDGKNPPPATHPSLVGSLNPGGRPQ